LRLTLTFARSLALDPTFYIIWGSLAFFFTAAVRGMPRVTIGGVVGVVMLVVVILG
jgi:hypothetical protein